MKRIPKYAKHLLIFFGALCLIALSVRAGLVTSLTNQLTANMSDLPRYTKLPLFNPHRKTFTCVYQDQHLPPVDPQAELWFQQALALDNPDVWFEDRDYPKIYELYQQAAQRNHWKAMLNLATLILSGYAVPEHNPEVAIRWVEKGMELGVPDAWDRMGVYHQNGLIQGGNMTTAYAFFQRAADMGSPAAMTLFGDKLGGTYDDSGGDFWGNRPIAIQMLQCAMAQGYGDAAYELGYLQSSGYSNEAKAKALMTFHEGVKLGSAKCASNLAAEFRGMNLSDGTGLVDRVDDSRAKRYSVLARALEFYGDRLKLPNLDKVLPLPPAPLPKWDGSRQTLIDAAKAVTPPPKPAGASGASLPPREQIPEGHGVLPLAGSPYSVTGDRIVPETGYWLALLGTANTPREKLVSARSGRPERYRSGERFEPARMAGLLPQTVQWHYLGQPRRLPPSQDVFLGQMVGAGWLRQLPAEVALRQCGGHRRCPQDGIWEARVANSHPQSKLFNTWTQQAFVQEGQNFPDPRDRFIDVDRHDVMWTYMGSPNVDGAAPGVRNSSL